MKRKYYIATVQVAIEADSEDQAGTMLDHYLNRRSAKEVGILSWQYIPPLYIKPQYAGTVPENAVVVNESDAFSSYIEPIE